MKHFYLIFYLFFLVIECNAASIIFDDERFTYETTSNSTVKITKYKGSEKSVVFPTEITKDGNTYQVTSIVGTLSVIPSDNTDVEEIFIPSGITKIQNVTRESKSLKAAVIEDGVNLTVSNAFYIGQESFYNQILDNITVLTSCDATSSQFISSNASNYLFKTGTIEVFYQGNMGKTTIQMYLYEKGNFDKRPFGKTRFNYLLSALQKSGKDISTIKTIDLSNLLDNNTNKHAVRFTFDADNYDPSSELSPDAEVIISEKESYANGVKYTIIPDKEDFTVPTTDQPLNISYTRSNTENWNSVCLPFGIKESDFGTSCKIYTVTSESTADNQISLTRVENSETVVEAGKPCFIYSSDEQWNLKMSDVSFNNVEPKTTNIDNHWQVVGSFTNETIGSGRYKLNSSGTEFGITKSDAATVTAFRCYLNYTGSQGAPNRLSVNIDEEASITLVPNDAEPQKVKLYDLMGRPRKEGSKGFFIKSTR